MSSGRKTVLISIVALIVATIPMGVFAIPPTPATHFYGDADGDMIISGLDRIQHKNVIASKPYTYSTLQPATPSADWNTCDVDSDRVCSGLDIIIINNVIASSPNTIGDGPWAITNPAIGGLPAIVEWASATPFRVSVSSTVGGLPSGRPGVTVVAEIMSGDGTIGGRLCTPDLMGAREQYASISSTCALSVTQTDWTISTTDGLNEPGAEGFTFYAPAVGSTEIRFTVNGNPALDMPTVSTRITVDVTPNNMPPIITSMCSYNASEDVAYTCDLTASDPDVPPQSLAWSVDPTDTCGGMIAGSTYVFTPPETMGDTTCIVGVKVADDGAPPQSFTQNTTVAIAETNLNPQISGICSTIAWEGSLYTCTLGATDGDLPAQTLTWSVDGLDTCGGSISGSTYSFIPNEIQGDANCAIGLQVSDGFSPSPGIADIEAFVYVWEVNLPPTGTAPAAISGLENSALSFDVNPSDPDCCGQLLSCQISSTTCPGGTFTGCTWSWTPDESQSPVSCIVTTRVFDGMAYSDDITTNVTVTETNQIPVISSTCWDNAVSGNPYTCYLAGSDADLPAQSLTWAISPSDTCGGSLVGSIYSWTPSLPQAGTICDLGVRLCDSFAPAGCADYTRSVSVAEPNPNPVITFDKMTLNDPGGVNIPNGFRITGGRVYMSGTVQGGAGTISGIMISYDGGATYSYNISFDSINQTWASPFDSEAVPEGTHNIMFRVQNSLGLFGYTTDAPMTDLGMMTITIDHPYNNIDLSAIPIYVCGSYTFITDFSGFLIPNSQKRVNLYLYHYILEWDPVNEVWVSTIVNDYELLDQIPDASGAVSFTLDPTGFSPEPLTDYYISATVYDSLNTLEYYTSSTWFRVNEGPAAVYPSISGHSWDTPLSGSQLVQLYFYSGCYGPATIEAQIYDYATGLKRSNFSPASLTTCYIYSSLNPTECVEGIYESYIDTNPSSCAVANGAIGDGEIGIFARGIDTNGIPFTGDVGYGLDVDNAPLVTPPGGSGPVGTMVGTNLNLAVETKDCDGVPSDNTHVTAVLTNNSAYYTGTQTPLDFDFLGGTNPPWDSNFGKTLQTSNWPVCTYGSGYFPDGNYLLSVKADDAKPSSPCYPAGTLYQLNYCGAMNNVSLAINNDPVNFNITGFNPLTSGKIVGNTNLLFHVEDCDLMANYPGSYVKMLVDGSLNNPATGAPWIYVTDKYSNGDYRFYFDSKQIEEYLGTHLFTVRVFDGSGAYIEQSQLMTIDNTGPCYFTPAPTYNKTFSGNNTTVVISGVLRKSDMVTPIINQAVNITDNTFGGGTRTVFTNTSGAWTVTFNYTAPKKYNISYTISIADNNRCNAATMPVNILVP